MKRIATANRAVDLFAAGKDGFRAAVPGVSDATYLSALQFNHLQEAVVRTIEAAGLVLSDVDYNQFVTALNTLITNTGEAFSTVRPLAATTVLTASDFGKLIKVTATGTTMTFPAIATAPAGKVLTIIAEFAAGTTMLKGNAAELLANTFGTTANTFTLNSGEAIQYVSNGVSWDPLGYEATVGVTPATGDRTTKLATTAMFANEFVSSLASSGYQKLPSGLILQWGALADAAWSAGVFRTVNYPITFPNTCLQSLASLSNSAGNINIINSNQVSTSQLQMMVNYTGAATARYFAIGN